MVAERGKWKFLSYATFLSTVVPLIQTWQIVRKTTKFEEKKILKFLSNLLETLIEVQSFHSICLKIGVKVKRSTCREKLI